MQRPSEADASAIVLVGGLGTRLGSLTDRRPKPMLPIAGRPFVEYILLQLRQAGFRSVVLAAGYLGDQLRDHFGSGDRLDLHIHYSVETAPLGTGGAIRLAAGLTDGDRLLVLNGDSFLDADPRLVLDALSGDIIVAMALTHVVDAGRYGVVDVSIDGTVIHFSPAGSRPGRSLINAGIYALHRSVIDHIPADRASSFERELLPDLVGPRLRAVVVDRFFVDIGVPDAYGAMVLDPSPILSAVHTAGIT